MTKINLATSKDDLYNALLKRDKTYDGFVWVCVKSTGIFCKLSCSARKPLKTNVEFVFSRDEAKRKNFRECKICRPNNDIDLHPLTSKLLQIISENEEKYWRNSDLKPLGIDESSARRAFKKDLGISFIEYARQKRLALALNRLAMGAKLIDAQLDAGFDSPSGFTDAIKRNFGANPSELKNRPFLSATWFETPIGPMLCIVNDDGLHMLEFAERKGLASELKTTIFKVAPVSFQKHEYHLIVKSQLDEYFAGTRRKFNLKLAQSGSIFEKGVWQLLLLVPFGETRCYSQIAKSCNNEKAVRAVARANGANKIAIIVPCHRIIGADGSLTGYGGQLWRKEWLLRHESKHAA